MTDVCVTDVCVTDVCVTDVCDRGVSRVSISRGEGRFVLLELAFKSNLGRQVCNFVLVPERTGSLKKASL